MYAHALLEKYNLSRQNRNDKFRCVVAHRLLSVAVILTTRQDGINQF